VGRPSQRTLTSGGDVTASPALRGQGFRGAAITLADRAQLNNDAFEHPAGDALLVRLSDRRARALPDAAGAYRMGGDEFCVLAAIEGNEGAAIARRGDGAERDRRGL
jgi:GGDEF domain-containing protein